MFSERKRQAVVRFVIVIRTTTTTRQLVEYPSIDVRVEPISPKEFLMDPSANTINEALGVAHEVIKPRYHVVEGILSGIYRDVPLDGDYQGSTSLQIHSQSPKT